MSCNAHTLPAAVCQHILSCGMYWYAQQAEANSIISPPSAVLHCLLVIHCFLPDQFSSLKGRVWDRSCAVSQVELPAWGSLDHHCSWQQLAAQLSAPAVIQHIASFAPSAILGVDWSSLPAYKAIAAALCAQHLPVPGYIYMNYRYEQKQPCLCNITLPQAPSNEL